MDRTAEPAARGGNSSDARRGAGTPFRIWVRRDQDLPLSCSLRFQVDLGKGVLRVSRPGVLIVPPARDHGFEDRLTPDQLRNSQFLHVPGGGRPRTTFKLDRLDDEALDGLDTETWYELDPRHDAAGAWLELIATDHEVLALGGSLAGPNHLDAPDPATLAHVASIVEVISARKSSQDDGYDEIIEADPESAVSEVIPSLAESPDTEDVEGMLAAARSADDQGEQASETAIDALSFADEVGVVLGADDEDANDGPSEGPYALPTSPPVHASVLHGELAAAAEDSQPTIPVEPLALTEEDETDVQAVDFLEMADDDQAVIEDPASVPELVHAHLEGGEDRYLVRHLRWDLSRHRMQVVELQARVERLEERLRQLGVDPDELK